MIEQDDGITINTHDTGEQYQHPAFIRAAALTSEHLREHFPKSPDEARVWTPIVRTRALAMRVLVVARTRIECKWAAYVDAIPGWNHKSESELVLQHGAKLDEPIARLLFPEFDEVPYAS